MISSMKIKLKSSLKFFRELECALAVVGKIVMSRIQWNLIGKIWIQNVGRYIDFEVISAAENSNK